MAERWVALLRGINLGSRNKVPMAELRRVFEEAGCEGVQTYIQSGNVVFTKSAPDRAELERAVADAFGVASAIVLRTADQLATVTASHPFGPDTSKSSITFLAEKPRAAAVRRLQELDIGADRVEVIGSDVFLHYPNGVQGARLTGALLEKTIGVAGTNRNWRTVAKLAELAQAE
jgi:uncharacterized protein (DUF1697 family)